MGDKLAAHHAKPRAKKPHLKVLRRPSERGFEQALSLMWERLEGLQRRVAADSAASDTVLSEAFEEMQITLEELHVAQEEWQQQSHELGSTRQTLEEERRRYQELFDFAPCGYVLTDATAVIQQANRAAAALLKVPQHRLPGKPLALFVADGERRAFYAQLGSRRGGQAWPGGPGQSGGRSVGRGFAGHLHAGA